MIFRVQDDDSGFFRNFGSCVLCMISGLSRCEICALLWYYAA